MISGLLLLYALTHLALLFWSFRLADPSWRLWLLRALLIGMFYDNLIVAVGPWAIEHEWYAAANVPRFALHAVLLPFLAPFAWSAMRVAGVRIAQGSVGWLLCCLWVVPAIAWGFWHEVLQLDLVQRDVMGHSRLVSASGMPPWATILTNLAVIPMAAAVWRASGWAGFFMGSVFIFLVNGATGAQPWGFICGNGAEVVFVLSLLLTERFLVRARGPEPSETR